MSAAIQEASHLHVAARIVQKTRENARTTMLALDAAMEAAPGQFAMLWLPGVDEKPFSIAGADPLSFAVSRVGPFSEVLHGLERGPGSGCGVRSAEASPQSQDARCWWAAGTGPRRFTSWRARCWPGVRGLKQHLARAPPMTCCL